MRLDHEFGTRGLKLGGEALPLRHRQDHAEVPHRDLIAVDQARRVAHRARRHLVRDDLMAMKIEVDPFWRTAPFGTTEKLAVEPSRGVEVGDRKGEMEARIVSARDSVDRSLSAVSPVQFCMPHLRTVLASIVRKITFSTSNPMTITVNRPANTLGISS